MNAPVITPPQPGQALGSDELYEIVNGERKEIPHMGALAGTLATMLVEFINAYARPRRLGLAVIEVLFRLRPGRPSRRPDVAFMALDRWPITDPSMDDPPEWDVVPNLAVEVISPTNSAVDTEEKLRDYFDAGVQLVWVIYPGLRRIYVYESRTQVRVFEENAELDGGTVLPGFRLPIADLFAAMVLPPASPPK